MALQFFGILMLLFIMALFCGMFIFIFFSRLESKSSKTYRFSRRRLKFFLLLIGWLLCFVPAFWDKSLLSVSFSCLPIFILLAFIFFISPDSLNSGILGSGILAVYIAYWQLIGAIFSHYQTSAFTFISILIPSSSVSAIPVGFFGGLLIAWLSRKIFAR